MNGSGSRLGPEVFDHVESARRRRIDDYACHGEARALYKGERRTMAGRRDKTSRHLHVARERDPDGYVLPTSRELDFLRRIASWIRFCLPWGFETEAWFVRGFLKVFAYSGDVPKREVLRRRSIARHAVADGCTVDQLAALIQLPAVEAEILHEWALQCTATPWWSATEDSDLGDGLLDEHRDGGRSAADQAFDEEDDLDGSPLDAIMLELEQALSMKDAAEPEG